MKYLVTLEVEADNTTSHPRNWDWIELVGMGTEYISSEKVNNE